MRLKLHLVLLTLISLIFVGCLDTKRKVSLTYDAASDEFRVLRLYYHIRAENDGDVAYLAALYANRDHLILYDPLAIINENAAVRVSATQYQNITLGQPAGASVAPAGDKPGAPASAPAAEAAIVDLSKINIQPGKFFLSPEKTICYYQQMTVPGSMVDKLLDQANTMLQQGIADPLQSEQKRRADGGPTATWDELRRQIIALLNEQGAATAPADPAKEPPKNSMQDNPLQFLSNDSLKILLDSAKDKTLAISRKGSLITVNLKVSPADAAEFKATLDMVKRELLIRIAKQTDAQLKRQMDAGVQVAGLLNISDPKDGQFTISLDAVKAVDLVTTLMESEHPWEEPDKEKEAGYPLVVEGLKQRQITVDDKIQLTDVIAQFKKGQLAVNPPAKSLPPGEGLFSASTPPATEAK